MSKLPHLLLIAVVAAVTNAAWAQSDADLKQRVLDRSKRVEALVHSGSLREGNNGLLSAVVTLDDSQAQTVQEENKDRQVIFGRIAEKSKLTTEEVVAMFARRAQKRNSTAPRPPDPGSCGLAPAKGVDVARLLQYMKQGMNYAAMRRPESALAEFQQALTIDRNFLGLSLNVGSSHLALKKYTEAETAFREELKLIACLDPVADGSLAQFGYMLEVRETDTAKRAAVQAAALRAQLGKVKALTYYNLAGCYSLQKQKEPALAALRDAVKAGFTDRQALASDSDLAFIRSSQEFGEIARSVRQ